MRRNVETSPFACVKVVSQRFEVWFNMSLFWPIFWFGLILAAILATIIVAVMEQSQRKAALKALEPSHQSPESKNLDDSMESLDSFPAAESADDNFEFTEMGNKERL